jgi:hypothetical protein
MTTLVYFSELKKIKKKEEWLLLETDWKEK